VENFDSIEDKHRVEVESLSHMKIRHYSSDLKKDYVSVYHLGVPIQAILETLNISRRTFDRWVDKYARTLFDDDDELDILTEDEYHEDEDEDEDKEEVNYDKWVNNKKDGYIFFRKYVGGEIVYEAVFANEAQATRVMRKVCAPEEC